MSPKKSREQLLETSREQQAVSDDHNEDLGLHPRIGGWYAFVTVGPIYHGRLKAITPTHYILEEMSWIPDTGRLHLFVKDPTTANEAEYIGDGGAARSAEMGFYVMPEGALKTK